MKYDPEYAKQPGYQALDTAYYNPKYPIQEEVPQPMPEITAWLEEIANRICVLDDSLRILDEKLNPILSPVKPTDPGMVRCEINTTNTDLSKILVGFFERIGGFTNRVQSLIERQQIS